MASVKDLKGTLMDTLEKRGVVGKLKAMIRTEIFASLEEEQLPKPKVTSIKFHFNESCQFNSILTSCRLEYRVGSAGQTF